LQSPVPELGSPRLKEGAEKSKEPTEEKVAVPDAVPAEVPGGPAVSGLQPEPRERRDELKETPEAGEGALSPSSPQGKCESGEEEKEGVSE
ncbi:hypothetical protein chiPu_0029975, partial [Chiloscyllium punctatum]|nr:hypothetical protein [Chiloscyllium punctatum]